MSKSTKIFLNLAVKDLNKSKKFFARLGYKFNPQFTDKNAACLIISKDIYAMLLVKKFFKKFTKKEIVDSRKAIESIITLSVESRKAVDKFIEKVLAAGGKVYREAEDYGWMYGRSFEDPDGHHWEVFWMDITKYQKQRNLK